MLAEYLRQREGEQVRWQRIMEGVQVCRFALPEVERAELPVCLPPGHFETFFCQGGQLRLERTQGRLLRAADREICCCPMPVPCAGRSWRGRCGACW